MTCNINEIKELCAGMESEVIDFEYDRYNHAGGGEGLGNLLGKNQGTILLDISAVSRFLIVQFLVAIIFICLRAKALHHKERPINKEKGNTTREKNERETVAKPHLLKPGHVKETIQ